MSAADVPELVEAGGKYIAALRRSAKLSGEVDPSPHSLSRAALMAVPAPLRPIDPDDDQQRHAVEAGDPCGDFPMDSRESLTALRDLGVGLPAGAEPSDAAVDAAAEVIVDADGLTYDHLRAAVRAAYAVDGAK